MKIRFLLDENLNPRIKLALWHHDSTIDVLRVGDLDTPSLGTLDPDILRYLHKSQRLLVTDNRRTMPPHAAEYFASGGNHWGVFLVDAHTPIGRIAEAMYLLWFASEAEEWVDQEQWLPV
jgi:Domain of unknown function (DUF5615)